MRRWPYLLIAIAVLALDQATKAWIIATIPQGQDRPVSTWFTLTHWMNPGSLFGFLSNIPPKAALAVFLVLPTAGIVFLGYLFAKAQRRLELVLLAAILGGAVGNIVDRLRFGAVVDFLYFHLPDGPGWPSFNVADACLSTGIVALLALTLFRPSPEGDHAPDSLHHR
jgi:signal peptidase II